MKKLKFVIESNLENVALVGMSVKKICSMIPLSEMQLFQIELCTVEAVNNSIIHAYNRESMHEVDIILTIKDNYLSLEIVDKGEAMDNEVLEKASLCHPDEIIDNPETISETGRGLALIKEYMDKVSYRSDNRENSLIMIKYL